MSKPTADSVQHRPLRIFWANVYCLLDTSSGASMSARQMLTQLCKLGHEVHVLGATVLDSERGTTLLQAHWADMQTKQGQFIEIKDGVLAHQVLVTASIHRAAMTNHEEGLWMAAYHKVLHRLKPDIVFYYGGQSFDWLIASEAKFIGAKVVAYLVNGNYGGERWCRDVDLIITDSQATADFYNSTHNYDVRAVGTFIDPAKVVAAEHTRQRILFVNPAREKGAGIVAQLALLFEKVRPDIVFEVVESRGRWSEMVRIVTAVMDGKSRDHLSNVVVTPNTTDMRPLYGRARLLLAPSLWWESGARVLAEAMLNGIPAIVTRRGGSPEMIGDGGLKVELPAECYERPYSKLPKFELLRPLVEKILRLYDHPQEYEHYARRAYNVGQQKHNIAANTRLLAQLFEKLCDRQVTVPKTVHAFVISWEGHEEHARHIATQLVGKVDFLTVIYSNATAQSWTGPGQWHQVPNDWYYGKKFREALRLNQGDIHLQIQADADSPDWAQVVSSCKTAFDSVADLGVWAADADFTPWHTNRVALARHSNSRLAFVAQTDGVVWAMSHQVRERLKSMDFERNNLGWGIDWAAIAFAYANHLTVVRDTDVLVRHPKGTGYSGAQAKVQMDAFLKQLTSQEQLVYLLLNRSVYLNDHLSRMQANSLLAEPAQAKEGALAGLQMDPDPPT
ncbi:MAG: glycosyltransferase [Limnohabitans sp.]